VSFPASDSITEDAADLIKKLLVKNPDDRLGSNSKLGFSFKDLKNHSYFKNIDFSTIFTQKVP
jgi:serine/threonine protein kinase